jgi:hypothetical protein
LTSTSFNLKIRLLDSSLNEEQRFMLFLNPNWIKDSTVNRLIIKVPKVPKL